MHYTYHAPERSMVDPWPEVESRVSAIPFGDFAPLSLGAGETIIPMGIAVVICGVSTNARNIAAKVH